MSVSKYFKILTIFLIFGMMIIGCDNGIFSNLNKNADIRYDGVYYRERPGYIHYIRFYEDKTVITISLADTIALTTQMLDWFNKEQPFVSKGIFTITGKNISFQAISEQGSVDYNGKIFFGKLILDIHSNINGNVTKNAEYILRTW